MRVFAAFGRCHLMCLQAPIPGISDSFGTEVAMYDTWLVVAAPTYALTVRKFAPSTPSRVENSLHVCVVCLCPRALSLAGPSTPPAERTLQHSRSDRRMRCLPFSHLALPLPSRIRLSCQAFLGAKTQR